MEPSHCSGQSAETAAPGLKKVLGRRDLILFFVAAVANLNIVPAVAAAGPLSLWIWVLALSAFFWPQGVAVTELSARWPGEGGVYLWTRNSFGEMHSFIAAWCYWLSNVVYLPTVLLSCVGVAVYTCGPSVQALAGNARFAAGMAIVLLILLAALNVFGESAAKWIANLGGMGTLVGAVVICGLAALVLKHHGGVMTSQALAPHFSDWRMLAIFGTICYSLVGLDLASVKGDEIREPRKVLPGAIFWGGVISGVVYLGVTAAMLVALPREKIGVMTGVLQSISSMATQVHLEFLVMPVALFEAVAILGTAAAWYSGAARMPFVAGIDNYLPQALGKIHPRFHTPYVALIVFAILSALMIIMSNMGASISEAYLTLLAISVVLQMVPNVYMFCALLKLARHRSYPHWDRKRMVSNGTFGLGSSVLAICLAFVPGDSTEHLLAYELKMIVAIGGVLGVALVLYFRARRRKRASAQRESANKDAVMISDLT